MEIYRKNSISKAKQVYNVEAIFKNFSSRVQK